MGRVSLSAAEREDRYRTMIGYAAPAVRRERQGRVYGGARPRGRVKLDRGARWEQHKFSKEWYIPKPEKYPGQRRAYLVGASRPMSDREIREHNDALVAKLNEGGGA